MGISSRPKAGHSGNWLLDRLSPADFKALAASLEPVQIRAGQAVFRSNDLVEHVYFPTTAVLSLTVSESPDGGRSMEFASVGHEGMVGFTALLGIPVSLHHVTCQNTGSCWRLATPLMLRSMSHHAVDDLVKRYVAIAYRTAVQAVLCNSLHAVEQRVCRWLLATHDKSAGDVTATQDLLAAMLGVKRPTVSLVANSLQKAGLISYHRGSVQIINLAGLEQSACACYRVTKMFYDRLIK